MNFFLRNRILLAIIPLMCIGMIFAGISADDSTKSYTDKSVTSKKVLLSDIPDGSRIDSAGIVITALGDSSETCVVKLLDPILDDIYISQKFPCYGTRELPLSGRGMDAMEYNLAYNQAKFEVIDMKGNVIPFDVSGFDVNYSPPEYFAKIENGTVTNVIVADQAYADSLSGEWVQTWVSGSSRHNYAGVGYIYNKSTDAFYEPQPYPSWSLDQSYKWQPPVPYPADGGKYVWDEKGGAWVMSK